MSLRNPEAIERARAIAERKRRDRALLNGQAIDGGTEQASSNGGDDALNGAAEPWPEPEALPAGMPPVDRFDPDLLPEAFREWITDTADRMQCPLDFPAVAALVALASVVGRQVGIRPKRHDDWLVVPNLWGLIVGRPGVLKTPAILEPLHLLNDLEAAARTEHEEAIKEHDAGRLVRKVAAKEAEKDIRKALKDNRDANSVARAFVDDEEDEPTRRRYITNDTTVEKLGELLAANPRGVLVYRDELAGFLANLDREGREGSRAFFLEAWNGTGRFTFDRIGRGTVDIEAACVSILGGIQPGRLAQYITGALTRASDDDGLLQRFQVTVWPDVAGTWRNVDRAPDSDARARARRAIERLDRVDAEALGVEATDGEHVPWLRFEPAAQEIFDDWRGKLERRLRSGSEHPAFEAHLSKYRSLVPSLALLLHLADTPAGGPISETALLQALAWAEYLESHARRLYSPALDPALTAARELDRRINKGDLPAEFTARDVYRKCWHLLDRDATQAALTYLADFSRVCPEQRETAGRNTTVWRVNPALRGERQ